MKRASLLVLLMISACSFATTMTGVAHYSYYNADPVLNSYPNPTFSITVVSNIQGYTAISCGCPPWLYHQPKITITMKDHATGAVVAGGVTAYGPQVSPPTNVNFTSSLTFDAQPQFLIDEDANDEIFCSLSGIDFAQFLFSIQVEGAYTRADWRGAPAPSCTPQRVCTYAVVNNCILPPLLNMVAVTSGDYRNIATYLSWMNASVCINILGAGWHCLPPLSFLEALNGPPLPPYTCTEIP